MALFTISVGPWVKNEITMENFAATDDTTVVEDTKINLVFDGGNLIGLDQVTPDQVKKATKPKKEKPYKCSKCPCAFTELKQLEVHMTYEHYAFCEVCGIEFEDRHGLKVHMAGAHMINMVDCSRCHKTFMEMEALKVHMKNDHFQCDDCGYISSTLQGLSKHKSSHKQCEHCKLYFNGKHGVRLYKAHVQRCGNRISGKILEKFKCNVCYDIFPAMSKLKRHQKSRKCMRRTEYYQELKTERTHIKQEKDKKEDDFANNVLPKIISNLQQAQEIISKDPKFERGLKMKKFLKIVLKTYNAGRPEMEQTVAHAPVEQTVTSVDQLVTAMEEQNTAENVVMEGVHFMTKESYGLVKMK